MVSSASPTVLKRYIALELQRLREAADVKRPAVAERLGCALTTVTHVETARNLPKLSDLEIMLGMYGVPERIAPFRTLVTAAKKGKDWWVDQFAGAAPEWFDLMLGMERMAVAIESYDATIVPGLFQTPEYAEALIRLGEPGFSDDEVTRLVDQRMARQDVLYRQPDPPTVWAVLDEAILLRPVGSEQIMADQVEQLIRLTEIPLLTLQILPLSTGMHVGMDGPFIVLTFQPEMVDDPGVVYTDSRVGAHYYEKPAQLRRYRDTLTRLRVQALKPEESLTYLKKHLKGAT